MATGYIDPLKKNPYQQVATSTVAPGANIGPTIPGQQMKPQATTPAMLTQPAAPAPKPTPQPAAATTATAPVPVTNPYSAQSVATAPAQTNLANPYRPPAVAVSGQSYTSAPVGAGSLSGYGSGGVWNGPAQPKVTATSPPPPPPPPPPATGQKLGAYNQSLSDAQASLAASKAALEAMGPRPTNPAMNGYEGKIWDQKRQSLMTGIQMDEQNLAAISSPAYKQLVDAMEKQGWNRFIGAGEVSEALKRGISPETLIQHYQNIIGKYGGNGTQAYMAGHGANLLLSDDVLNNLAAGRGIGLTGWTDPRWDMSEADRLKYTDESGQYDPTGSGRGDTPIGTERPADGGAPPRTGGTTPLPAPRPRTSPRRAAAPTQPGPTGYVNPYAPRVAVAPGMEQAPAPAPTPAPAPPPSAPPRSGRWGEDPRLAEIVKRGMAALFPGLG